MMKRSVMTVAALVALAAGATSAEAQIGGRQVEVRLDMVQLQLDPTALELAVPGSAAVGVYLSNRVAVEGRVGFFSSKIDDETFSGFGLGAFVPFYLKGDAGRSGLFVAPGLEFNKFKDMDAMVDYGVDVGLKLKKSEMLSWRVAATLRDGDSYGDMALGATLGLGIFFK
jgi:hypothetical protein